MALAVEVFDLQDVLDGLRQIFHLFGAADAKDCREEEFAHLVVDRPAALGAQELPAAVPALGDDVPGLPVRSDQLARIVWIEQVVVRLLFFDAGDEALVVVAREFDECAELRCVLVGVEFDCHCCSPWVRLVEVAHVPFTRNAAERLHSDIDAVGGGVCVRRRVLGVVLHRLHDGFLARP